MCIVCIVCIVYITCTYRGRDLYAKYFFPPPQLFFPKTFSVCRYHSLPTGYTGLHTLHREGKAPQSILFHTLQPVTFLKIVFTLSAGTTRYRQGIQVYTLYIRYRQGIQVYTLYIVREKPPRAYFFHTLHFSHTSTYPMSLFHIVLFPSTQVYTLYIVREKPPEHTFSHASTS